MQLLVNGGFIRVHFDSDVVWNAICESMSFSIFTSRLVIWFSILMVITGKPGSIEIVTNEIHQLDHLHSRIILG
jgi:hypothetical protein